jgi:hypothetical protein
MNCRGVSHRLSAFIDNNLSPGIREAVEEHLNSCVPCRRQLSEFEAIVTAARNLAPMTVSEGFTDRVIAYITSEHNAHETLLVLRSKLTLAGVGFMVAAAAIFFLLGPPSNRVPHNSFTAQEGPAVGFPGVPDLYSHPEAKVYSFPLPEDAQNSQLARNDSMAADSASSFDQFVLPGVQGVKQNVNIKVQGR